MIKVKCLYKSNDLLGESPLWINEENSIYWVDIKKNCINKLNINESKKQTWYFDEPIGCIAHSHEKIFIAGTKNGFGFINLETNQIIPIVNPEKNLSNNRFNDGLTDNNGRFYAGTMDEKGNETSGNYYILYNDLTFKKINTNFITTNGPIFSPDYKKIYFTDTRNGKIYSSKLSKEGLFNNKEVFISVPLKEGKPDGMAIDEEGNLWVALFGGSCINCYNHLGKKINQIFLPTPFVTSCAFGGGNLDILFITTSSFKLNEIEKKKDSLAGSLFSIKLKVKGIKINKFKYIK